MKMTVKMRMRVNTTAMGSNIISFETMIPVIEVTAPNKVTESDNDTSKRQNLRFDKPN